MTFRQPLRAEIIIGKLQYRTEGATLLSHMYGDALTGNHAYLLRTANGSYFMQVDSETRGASSVTPLSPKEAARCYKISANRAAAFPDPIDPPR